MTDFKAGNTKQALRTSLEKLGLDYVDLYLIHWPAPEDEKYLEAWKGLEELQDEGLTRSIGVSNFLPHHLDRVAETGTKTPAINQIEIHPALQQREAQAANEKYGIRTQAWSPLAQGAVFGDEPSSRRPRPTGSPRRRSSSAGTCSRAASCSPSR